MIYLDTHVVVWLYTGQVSKLSVQARDLINENPIYISAIVRLELQYLYEIQRITDEANEVLLDLSDRIGLKICDQSFNTIISETLKLSWARDPFDRIIVANAALSSSILVTKDQYILENYGNARW
ncbi:MAG: PIN domain-containing protein [Spirochaetales bacterium]|nr:PIN domain-containing protein [Spirochaetales bacterium]